MMLVHKFLKVANATGFGAGFLEWRPTAPSRTGFYNLSNGSLVPFTFLGQMMHRIPID